MQDEPVNSGPQFECQHVSSRERATASSASAAVGRSCGVVWWDATGCGVARGGQSRGGDRHDAAWTRPGRGLDATWTWVSGLLLQSGLLAKKASGFWLSKLGSYVPGKAISAELPCHI